MGPAGPDPMARINVIAMEPITLSTATTRAMGPTALGTLVEQVGDGGYYDALMAWSREALGASDCSVIVHRHGTAELAGATSIAGSRAREFGDWYMRGGYYRMEPNLRLADAAGRATLMNTLRPAELPDATWAAHYASVGLAERLSLLVPLDDGWAFMNAYRAPQAAGTLSAAGNALASHGSVLAAALRRHLALTTRPPEPAAFALLSERERQVVQAILAGDSAKVAARQLNLSPTSIATYRQRAFEKLGIRRQVQLFQLMQHGGEH